MFTKSGKVRVYLASGWFNVAQVKQMNEVYTALQALEKAGKIEFFAPYYDGIVLSKDDPNRKKKMGIVWWLDIEMVKACDVIIACTQDHDVGTMFEAGYASAKGKTIFCYNSDPELGLNVMLSQESKGFLRHESDINDALHKFDQTPEEERKAFRYNEFKGEPT